MCDSLRIWWKVLLEYNDTKEAVKNTDDINIFDIIKEILTSEKEIYLY